MACFIEPLNFIDITLQKLSSRDICQHFKKITFLFVCVFVCLFVCLLSSTKYKRRFFSTCFSSLHTLCFTCSSLSLSPSLSLSLSFILSLPPLPSLCMQKMNGWCDTFIILQSHSSKKATGWIKWRKIGLIRSSKKTRQETENCS